MEKLLAVKLVAAKMLVCENVGSETFIGGIPGVNLSRGEAAGGEISGHLIILSGVHSQEY